MTVEPQEKEPSTVERRSTAHRLGSPVFLRNYWYPISRSQDLGAAPRALVRLGYDLVLWRDSKGVAHAQSDCCPHRGTRLSNGRVIGDCIECPYHHFRFGSSGQCELAPFEGAGGPLAKQLHVRAFPTEERAGLIWAWMSDVPDLEPPPLIEGEAGSGFDDVDSRYPINGVPYELAASDWAGEIEEVSGAGNWRFALENLVDAYHGSTLHADTLNLSKLDEKGLRSNAVTVQANYTRGGGISAAVMVDGKASEVGLTAYPNGFVVLSLDVGLSRVARVNQWVVPTDYHNIVNYSSYRYPVAAPDYEQFRTAYEVPEAGGRDTMRSIYEEDSMAVDGQLNGWQGIHVDHFGQIDQPIIKMRRLVDRLLAEEASLHPSADSTRSLGGEFPID